MTTLIRVRHTSDPNARLSMDGEGLEYDADGNLQRDDTGGVMIPQDRIEDARPHGWEICHDDAHWQSQDSGEEASTEQSERVPPTAAAPETPTEEGANGQTPGTESGKDDDNTSGNEGDGSGSAPARRGRARLSE